MQKPLGVHVRWMIRRDMPAVLGIESFTDHPWCEEDWIRELRQRNCIAMVAEHGEQVAGVMLYELHKRMLHVLRFGVHPQYRRRGVGAALIKKLADKLSPGRRCLVHMQVEERNLGLLLFLKAQGFEAVEIVKQPYAHSDDDGILMELRRSPQA